MAVTLDAVLSLIPINAADDALHGIIAIHDNSGLLGALANDWTTSTDGLTWTFHLQPNVTWQDGSPFTADDVIFTLTLCESPNVGCVYGGGISNITGAADVKNGKSTTLAGVAAPDPQTVTITTDNATPGNPLAVGPGGTVTAATIALTGCT